jgi:hypothetical protein
VTLAVIALTVVTALTTVLIRGTVVVLTALVALVPVTFGTTLIALATVILRTALILRSRSAVILRSRSPLVVRPALIRRAAVIVFRRLIGMTSVIASVTVVMRARSILCAPLIIGATLSP